MKKKRTKESSPTTTDQEVIDLCLNVCSSKKALGPRVIDVRKKTDMTDYFLICSGQSEVQVQAIADGMRECLKKNGVPLLHVEGYENGQWILLDLGFIIIHVFCDYVRDIYDLEGLWGSS